MRALNKCATASLFCMAVVTLIDLEPSNLVSPVLAGGPVGPVSRTAPEPPRETVDIAEPPQTGRRIQVPRGGDLQAALDQAKPGDRIALEQGAVYRGPFHLRPKEGSGWIVVASAASDRLPVLGERVNPSHASLMPKLRASALSVIVAEPGAHHYRFVGVDIAPTEGTFLYALAQLGNDETDVNSLPHHIIFDRSYLHGDAKKGTRRGIAMNSRHTAVINSYLSDFKEVGADSQAIAGWNGSGPFTITNNYLEAAGENVMFGGADPTIADLVPADIEVTGNHLSKPLSWKKDRREFQGTPWTVKNLFELKNARRVVIDGNLFEYNWADAQNGFAILFTVRNQSGGAPWSVVEDVTFSNNLVRHAGGGINLLGRDDNHPSQQTKRIAIRNNLFVDIADQWGTGRLFQLLDGTTHISINHNTAFQTGNMVFGGDHEPHTGFVFENNVAPHNQYGITASGTGSGKQTLDRYFPGALVRRNLLIGADASNYPRDNFFPATLEEVGFIKQPDGFYRLELTRRYAKAGSDGHDPGADIDAITGAMTHVASARDSRISAASPEDIDFVTAQLPVLDNLPFDPRIEPIVVFWVSLFLLAYVYLGYPLMAWLRAIVLPKHHVRAPLEPFVSVIVVAHDEADCIEARIENLLGLDYPKDRLEIIIGSDGSTDDTPRRAGRYVDAGVTVHSFVDWRGKSAVLSDLVPGAKGEIVILGDARQRWDSNVLRVLVSHFADPTVGAVSGELILTVDSNGTSAGQGTAFYWRYEKFIRSKESRAASTVGATGSIYALRRSLFEPIPPDTILDDVLIPLRIIRRGYFVLFEPNARAYDKASSTAHQEYVRKLRTIAGTFQLFAREPWLLNPLQNPIWFETISHKALRLAIPILHVAVFGANLALTDGLLYQGMMAAQVGFYAAALAGHAFRHAQRRPKVITVPYAMCVLTWATVAGFASFVTHRQHATWERAYPSAARS